MLQEGEQDVFQKPTWQPEPLCGTKCQSGSASLLLPCDAVSLRGGAPTACHREKRGLLSVALEAPARRSWLLWDVSI